MTAKNARPARGVQARKDLPAWVVVTAIVAVVGVVFAIDRWRLSQLPGEYHPSQWMTPGRWSPGPAWPVVHGLLGPAQILGDLEDGLAALPDEGATSTPP